MSTPHHEKVELITVTASGPATDNGRISLSELARIASGLQATLERIAYSVYIGRKRPGRFPREIADAVRLDFTGFHHGSAVMKLERPDMGTLDDLFSDSFHVLSDGLTELTHDPSLVPNHFNPTVINGLVTLCGGIAERNITKISFAGIDREFFALDSELRQKLIMAQKATPQQELTIVGRLHMGDFDPLSLRCRIDTHAGSVSCDLGDDLKDTVLDLIDTLVIASGIAEMQSDGATVRVLHLAEIEEVATSTSGTLDDLAEEQGVHPIGDLASLQGEPIEDFEKFLEIVRSAR